MIKEVVEHLNNLMAPHGPAEPSGALSYSPGDFSVHFFLQLSLILTACVAARWIGRRFLGQPPVVCEMIAGVLLGPSLLGLLLPSFQVALFPKPTRDLLYAGAQLGVGLYMFIVGLTLRVAQVRAKIRTAAAVSAAGIAVPFLLAALIAPQLLHVPGLFQPHVNQLGATLFLGACIALTAFPMLARIINERGLDDSALGSLSLVAGAIDDVVSWCVLAIVLATFGGGPSVAFFAIGGAIAYTAFLLTLGRRWLAALGRIVDREGAMGMQVFGITLALFCLSAFLMDAIGIHAIFGGFLLGACMPRGLFAEELRRKAEPLTVALLLPMFFTYSGLNTRISMVNSWPLLLIALAILAASILGKFGACYAAARLCGEDSRTAKGIGLLMNSRGLMELIIVNIGIQRNIIGPTLFTMLVLMAIVTTMMAGPLFDRLHKNIAPATSA